MAAEQRQNAIARRPIQQSGESIEKWQVGFASPVLLHATAAAEQQGRSLQASPAQELSRQRGFSNARLARKENDFAGTVDGLLQMLAQPLQLALAAHKGFHRLLEEGEIRKGVGP